MDAEDNPTLTGIMLIEATQLSGTEVARLLGLSAPAYERCKRNDTFSRGQRSKLVRVINVIERAQRVLDGRTRALQWLMHPNRTLHASSPLALLGTKAGAQRVYGLLTRIEAGRLT